MIPSNDKGVNLTKLCVENISCAVKIVNIFNTARFDRTGFTSAVSRWILTMFVHSKNEYWLNLTRTGAGREKTLNKAWISIWNRPLLGSTYNERTSYSRSNEDAINGV